MLPLKRCSAPVSFLFACSAVTAVVLLKALPASAASIQLSYTVTGGTFNRGMFTAPIGSGSLTYIVPTEGNTAAFTATAPPILQSLVLRDTDSNVFFSLLMPPGKSFLAARTTQFGIATIYETFPAASFHSGGGNGKQNLLLNHAYPVPILPSGSGSGTIGLTAGQTGTGPHHHFITQQEVRSVVPEPGTGLLMGMGLAGFAVGGRWGRKRIRARRVGRLAHAQ